MKISSAREFASFIGRRSVIWSVYSGLSSLLLILVEILIAIAIQSLIVNLGAMPSASSTFDKWLPKSLTNTGLLLIAIGMVRGTLQLAQGYGNFMIREEVLVKLRRLLLRDTLGEFGDRFVRSAEVQTNLAEVFPKAALCSYYVVNRFFSTLQSIGLALTLLYLSVGNFVVAVCGVISIGLLSRKSSLKLRALASEMPQYQMRLNEGLVRVARNWLYLRIMRTERQEFSVMDREIRAYHHASMSGVFWTQFNGVIAPFLGTVLIVLVLYLGQEVWHNSGLDQVSFIYMLMRFIASLTNSVNAQSAVNLNLPQLRKSMEYVAFCQSATPKFGYLKAQPPKDYPPPIEIKALTMIYHGSSEKIIDNLDLTIKGGEQLGILGSSGSGKTTLLHLILGILSPSTGGVYINGMSASKSFAEGHFRIGYVGPEPLLIEGSIRDNLLYGNEGNVADDRLWEALKAAQLDARIEEFASKLDQRLNEHADILSAGQKQRLSLARALVLRPQILILDEVSSNLDGATELQITESIAALRGTCTTVIVSHRPGILKYANRVVNLEKGGMVTELP